MTEMSQTAKVDTGYKFERYVNYAAGPLGKTTATKDEPNTASFFHFWVAKGNENLELGNVIAARMENGDLIVGMVIELKSVMDIDNFLADFISHDFGDPTIVPPSDFAEMIIAKVAVLKHTAEKIKPVGRAIVYFSTIEGIEWALGMSDYKAHGHGIPIGVMENGDGSIIPILLDPDFLLGPEGSHLNMSGISGLATKTSLVEFLLKSIITNIRQTEERKVVAVIFNVKGKDLLYLDTPNPQYLEDDAYTRRCRQIYEALNIPVEPFENIRIFAPYDKRSELRSRSYRRDGKVEYFVWELPQIIDDIPSLFEEETWDDAVEAVWLDMKEQIEKQPILSYDALMTWVNEERRNLTSVRITHWRGHEKEVFYKTAKNLDSLSGVYEGLIATGGIDSVDIPLERLENESIFIIDMQALNDKGQRMVFNKVLKRVYDILSTKKYVDFDTVIFFVDELNKFAPKEEIRRTPIKQSLIEICARGRSIGVSLFGVEQFMSQIDRQVVDNCSTIVYGRTGAGELNTENYAWLPEEIKMRLTSIPRGSFLLKHAKFTQPIFVRFPYPTCVPGDQYVEPIEAARKAQESLLGFKKDFK